jgi:hypothetical protein
LSKNGRKEQGRSVGSDTKCKGFTEMQRERRKEMEILNNIEITEHFERLKLSNSRLQFFKSAFLFL